MALNVESPAICFTGQSIPTTNSIKSINDLNIFGLECAIHSDTFGAWNHVLCSLPCGQNGTEASTGSERRFLWLAIFIGRRSRIVMELVRSALHGHRWEGNVALRMLSRKVVCIKAAFVACYSPKTTASRNRPLFHEYLPVQVCLPSGQIGFFWLAISGLDIQ